MNLILGAGFTGLAAGIKTGYPIFEATNYAGGICRNYIKDGFTFSNGGGHYLFGKGPGLDFVKSLVPVNEIERKAGVYYNTIFPYPFQTTANKDMDFEDKYGISLKLWLFNQFGKSQCNLFFHPFNEKYTAGLYDQIIQVDDYKSPPAGGKGFCPTFCDPVNGLSDLVDKMASKCTIEYNRKAIRIWENKGGGNTVEFEDGETIYCKKIISTIPLNKLMELCGQKVNLPYTSVLVINIGAVPEVNFPREHWLYIPFCNSGFYRVGFYSNVSQRFAPEGKVSLSVEIAFQSGVSPDINRICINVCEELARWGWIKQVLSIDATWVDCAYTWLYDRESRDNGIKWLKEKDIISIGRYGGWKFQGMVESITEGLNVSIC